MKLFRSICVRVLTGMALLSGCILIFLLSSMLHQSIADAGAYGAEEVTGKLCLMRDFIQRENAGLLGDAAWDALIDSKFREVFGTRGVLWKDGREVHNASPYVYDWQELEALCKDDARTSGNLLVSNPQRVGERWQIVFYRKEAGFGRCAYSLAYYEDVTDIYLRVRRLFLWGLGFTAALFCAVAALLYHGIYRLFEPLEELRRAALRVAEGTYDSPISVRKDNEIGEVAAGFNRMAERVREHVEALSEANEKQIQLIGSLSHEMKTPMTAIIGNADLLLTMRLGEQEREKALRYILEEAVRLSRLSKKMSELTGLYAQETNVIAFAQTEVGPLLGRLLSTMEVPLREKKAELSVKWEPEELEKRMDADLTLSLLQNLVDNACKASQEGGRILVTADAAQLCVQDFGRGIPKRDLARVTEAFYMVDKSRVKKQGGMGLGLALCSQIAHLHGWELCIESEEGAGTKVSLFW